MSIDSHRPHRQPRPDASGPSPQSPRSTPLPSRSDSRPPAADATESTAGRFLRALQLLLKSTRLYERNHPYLQEALAAAERELRDAQAAAASRLLGIRFETGGAMSTPVGRAIPDPRGELKPLAEELLRRGITTMVFLPQAHLGELGNLAALLAGKPPHLGPKQQATGLPQPVPPGEGWAGNWETLLDSYRITGIRINVALEEKKADTTLTGLVALVLSEVPGPTEGEPQTPAQTPDELMGALRLLARIGGVLGAGEGGVPETMLKLRSMVSREDRGSAGIAARGIGRLVALSGEPLESYLERLAETLVFEFVDGQFHSKRVAPRGLPALFARIARGVTELPLERPPAGPDAPAPLLGAHWTEEAWAEHLRERFWLELPSADKSAVLHSDDAWCMPVGVLRRCLETAPGSKEASRRAAQAVLLDYARCLTAEDSQARLATATGLSELRPVIEQLWPDALPGELVERAVGALGGEKSPEVAGILSAVVASLADLAFERGQYGVLDHILQALEHSPRDEQRAHLLLLARRLLQQTRWEALLNASLDHRHLDADLARVLGRDPERMLDGLGARLAEGQLESLSPMARLVRTVGEPAIGAMMARLFDPRQQRASTAVKLLSAACPERLMEALPKALPSWDWQLQDLAVSEMISACSQGALQLRSCGRIFLAALPQAHPLVVPMMLDQIGLAKEAEAVPVLLEVAAGKNERLRDVFVRIKAIEALGRLGPACGSQAADLLRGILRQRRGLTHLEPAGLRAAAEEALGLIENWPSSARVRKAREALEKSSVPHATPRRYLRIRVEPPLAAWIEGPQGAGARVRIISLGGAFLESARRLKVGDAFDVEIKVGLRRIYGKAVVRNISPQGTGVEFVHMKQDDREKLRKLVARLLRD